jgi:hypothetical protein
VAGHELRPVIGLETLENEFVIADESGGIQAHTLN